MTAPAAGVRRARRRARRLRARSRLRAANLRRTGAALRRRPDSAPPPVPVVPAASDSVETVWGAPRTLLWVTVKRDNPTWRDLYGHWWVEAGEESWGWWPRAVPVGLRQLALGGDGVLNGVGLIGRNGTWSRDAQHGQPAAHAFHPVLTEPVGDGEVLARMREHAGAFSGGWRWAWTRRAEPQTCRSFQDGLLRAAGLVEGLEHLASRGSGCPFLYGPRTLLWRTQDLLDRARAWGSGAEAHRLPFSARERGAQASELGLLPRCPAPGSGRLLDAPHPPHDEADDRGPVCEAQQVEQQVGHAVSSASGAPAASRLGIGHAPLLPFVDGVRPHPGLDERARDVLGGDRAVELTVQPDPARLGVPFDVAVGESPLKEPDGCLGDLDVVTQELDVHDVLCPGMDGHADKYTPLQYRSPPVRSPTGRSGPC